ncbi:hypothetical protein [Brucella pseudintermedia]|uniref:hypothetical protein n=1 Tax=Brucella pseudintermedia TaxID=370111 RepID=UPI00124D29DB|nr:hypothetical protein [Brucella pseudintermedia]KAB2680332.1 hypothetical protein F9K78_16715 [Brucella pseudintermedia]
MMDLQEAFDQGFEAVKSYVDRSFAAYEGRLNDLEKRLDSLPTPRDGIDGKDADPVAIAATVKEELADQIASIAVDAKGASEEAIAKLQAVVDEQKQAFSVAVSDLSDVKNGLAEVTARVASLQEASELPDIPKMIDEAISAKLGVEDMERSIEEVVRAVVAEIPAPQDGKSVTIEDVAPLIASEVEKRVSELPKPKDGKDGRDGLDVKDLFRAEGGILVATMSDGRVKELGRFVGEKGEPGKDGADGLGFDDLTVEYDGEKNFAFKFIKGERVKQFDFTLPVVLDRGIFTNGKEYTPGDGVTWAGHYWIAQTKTKSKPGGGDDWRIAVKRGRDGKTFTVKVGEQKSPVSLTKDEDNG